jgi:succinate dehydrogenase/fumarate reductase flavoprotein subunit
MELISFNLPMNLVEAILQSGGELPESVLAKGVAHYFLGGVKIDENCNSSVDGLFAAGEVTGGIFGAARLGGSAMADIIVFGARAGQSAAHRAKETDMPELDEAQVNHERNRLENMMKSHDSPVSNTFEKLRSILWQYMGVFKTEDILKMGLEKLSEIKEQIPDMSTQDNQELRMAIEASNILELGQIIGTTSLIRKESRGNYWRADYPKPDNHNWLKNVIVYKSGEEIMTRVEPVNMTRIHEPTEPPIGQGCFGYLT